MHIALVISSLSAGGAERVLAMMANYWVHAGCKVSLITIGSVGKDFFTIDERVARIGLNMLKPSSNICAGVVANIERAWNLRGVMRDISPDVVISFVDRTNILAIIACLRLGIPVIVSERTNPGWHKVGRIWSALRRGIYGRAAAVVVQTEDVRAWMEGHAVGAKLVVLPNPVNCSLCRQGGNGEILPGRVVVSVGRLERAKGFDVLVDSFSECLEEHPEWRLVIFGEGAERVVLEAAIQKCGRQNEIQLPGVVRDPESVIGAADIFVLPSRYEGFPNALLEAMACGLAVIATDCKSGPRDIITENVDGILVPVDDRNALKKALLWLMSSREDRTRLGRKALNTVQRFDLPRVMNLWDELIREVCSKYKSTEK